MRCRCKEVPSENSEALGSDSPCKAGYQMSPPGASRVGTVGRSDSVSLPAHPMKIF